MWNSIFALSNLIHLNIAGDCSADCGNQFSVLHFPVLCEPLPSVPLPCQVGTAVTHTKGPVGAHALLAWSPKTLPTSGCTLLVDLILNAVLSLRPYTTRRVWPQSTKESGAPAPRKGFITLRAARKLFSLFAGRLSHRILDFPALSPEKPMISPFRPIAGACNRWISHPRDRLEHRPPPANSSVSPR